MTKTILDEDQWDDRYNWLESSAGSADLISDTNNAEDKVLLKLIEIADEHYIWTQQDVEDGTGYQIVPGRQSGIGWYVTEKPWQDGDEIVVLLEGSDNEEEDDRDEED
jgi:hypothetical protein